MVIESERFTVEMPDLWYGSAFLDTPPDFAPFSPEDARVAIADRFTRVAQLHADRVAVQYGDESITYRELDARSNRLARTLLARCGESSEPVAILFDRGIAFFVACLGVWKAGKFVVPLDPHHPAARISAIWADVTAEYLLTDTANYPLGERIAGLGAMNFDTLDMDTRDDPLLLSIAPETPSAILYTSGSTGQPKGVIQRQRNLLFCVNNYANNFKLNPGDRVAFVYSLSVGIAYLIFTAALMAGATVYPADLMQIGVERFTTWLRTKEITFLQCVPSLFRRLATSITPGEGFPHLRIIILGGELSTRGDVDLFRRHFGGGTALANNYGLTECTPLRQYIVRADDTFPSFYVPVGYPVSGMRVRILGPEGEELPTGEIGEIVLSTRYISPGYWRQPGTQTGAFHKDVDDPGLWHFHTGDLGFVEPDGRLTCQGRKDCQVKIRGFRVEIAEVEMTLLDCPIVKEAVVTARKDERDEQMLAAYLVPIAGEQPVTRAVQAYLRTRLPDYMMPAAFIWLPEMPQTPTGKIDRLALPSPQPSHRLGEGEYEAPCNPVEEALAGIWAEVLGVERVGRHDDFFDLGGHSLLAALLFVLIEERLGKQLPLATILQASTVADVAALIQQDGGTQFWSSLIPIQPKGSLPAFFCVHPAGGDVLVFRELSVLLGEDQPFFGLQENKTVAGANVRDSIEEMAEYYLRHLRAFQPEGPYQLGGYSFGGVVAFEMARQLQAQGAQVDLLVLFDTRCPTYKLPKSPWKKRVIASIEKYRQIGLLSFLRSRPASLARASVRVLVTCLFKWHRLTGRPFPERLRGVSQFLFYRLASKRYRPTRYKGDMVLFRITGTPLRPVIEGDLGWRTCVDGAVEIRSVPGHHTEMFATENVTVLAHELHECLARVREKK